MRPRVGPMQVLGVLVAASCGLIAGMMILGAGRAMRAAPIADAPIDWADAAAWFGWTVLVAVGIGVIATAIALPAAWASRRMAAWWWAILCAPLMLPQYLIYASWGLLREPGTRLGAALEGAPTWVWQWAGYAQALGGLALWAMPIGAVIVGSAARRIDREALDALRMSGAGAFRRWRAQSGMVMPAILTSVCVVSMIMFGSAIPLHLARVQTYAVVVWRRVNESGWSPGAWMLALPLILFAAAAGVFMARRLIRACRLVASPGIERDSSGGRGSAAAAWLIWGMAVIVPTVVFASHGGVWHAITRIPAVFGDAIANSSVTAVLVASGSALIAIGTAAGLGAEARWVRRLALAGVYGWIVMAVVPGVLVGGALASAERWSGLAWLPDRMTLVSAHLARFGGVGAILGVLAHAVESEPLRDARRMLSGGGLVAWWRSAGRLQAGLILAAPVAGFALSLHEIEATVIAAPPGPGNLAEALLAKLHYLRDDELSAMGLALLASGILLGVIAGAMSTRSLRALRRGAPIALLAVAIFVIPACGRRDPEVALPIEVRAQFGGLNEELQLVYPRCIDTDGKNLWIIDKSGWVSRATLDGEPVARWKLPNVEKGYPVGVTAGPDGLIYIADTHQHQVAVYRPTADGAELAGTIGELGEGDGQFIYPTDVVIIPASDGVTPERIYVSEYGGNDRISAFDADGAFLFSFGHAPDRAVDGDVVLSRPQSMVFDPRRRELIVADAVDHRLGRFTLEGELIAWIGLADQTPGVGAGAFSYPYGLAMREDGSVAVAEYGGCRVQIIDPGTGEGLGIYGTAGRGEGQLVSPWGVAAVGRDLFVLDSGNNRVIRFRPERASVSSEGTGVASR